MRTWLTKAWAWLKAHKYWLILPAVIAAGGALLGLLRGRRGGPLSSSASAPGQAAPTGKAAQEIRNDVADKANEDLDAIRKKAEDDRDRIRKALGRIVK